MAWLEILAGPDQGKKLKLSFGNHRVGRDTASELFVNDSHLSRTHFHLHYYEDGTLEIEDAGSLNGTFYANQKIDSKTVIFANDIFRAGNTEMRVVIGNKAEYMPRPAAQSRNLARQFAVETDVIRIGRDPSNEIVIAHPLVSRFHARLVTEKKRSVLYDEGSTNGTYVNGRHVKEFVLLNAGDIIQICGARYRSDGTKLYEYDDTKVKLEASKIVRDVTLKGGKKIRLLDNVDLVISPREFVAVIGSSGAGKTTLLGALSGSRPATSGKIMINGRDFYREYDYFRSLIGYVPQDDIVHRELSVEEAFTYAARLRMPDDFLDIEIQARVEEVLSDLDLTALRSSPVHVLSGGERKRVNIGIELLTKPALFFLDEPTTGLDPGREKMIMENLRKLADQGRTIIMITHATSNLEMCDKVIILAAGGKLAFLGSPQEAKRYFNVNDFADIYKKLVVEQNVRHWQDDYRQSPYYQKYLEGLLSASQNETGNTTSADSMLPAYVNRQPGTPSQQSMLRQWLLLTSRYALILSRDRRNLFMMFLQAFVISILIVIVFNHIEGLFQYSSYSARQLEVTQEVLAAGQYEAVQQRFETERARRSYMSVATALMVFTAIWLGASNSAREITKELPVYKRERRINLQILPYLFSKLSVLSAISLVQVFILTLVVYLGLGFPAFFKPMLAFFLIAVASVIMGLAISATVSKTDKAVTMVPMLLVPQIILSGAFVPMSYVEPEIFRIVFYFAISKWGYELVGGHILDINSRSAIQEALPALDGSFAANWFVLILFVLLLFGAAVLAIKKKDNEYE